MREMFVISTKRPTIQLRRTPKARSSVIVFLNGILQREGKRSDYTEYVKDWRTISFHFAEQGDRVDVFYDAD